jgi:hypothetical protein
MYLDYFDDDGEDEDKCSCMNLDPYYCTAASMSLDLEEETENDWRDLEPCTCECHIGFE